MNFYISYFFLFNKSFSLEIPLLRIFLKLFYDENKNIKNYLKIPPLLRLLLIPLTVGVCVLNFWLGSLR